MPVGRRDFRAAETGLSSVERLLKDGETGVARIALDLIGPGTERVANPKQLARLRAAGSIIAGESGEAGHEAATEGEEYSPAGFGGG